MIRSLKVDVTGRPRINPVTIPSTMKGGKPGAIPNNKVPVQLLFTFLLHLERKSMLGIVITLCLLSSMIFFPMFIGNPR